MESHSEKEYQMKMMFHKIQIIKHIEQLLMDNLLDKITAYGAMTYIPDIDKQLIQ